LCGGWSPILGSLVLLLGFGPILEGAIAGNVALFMAFKTLLIVGGEGINWFHF